MQQNIEVKTNTQTNTLTDEETDIPGEQTILVRDQEAVEVNYYLL